MDGAICLRPCGETVTSAVPEPEPDRQTRPCLNRKDAFRGDIDGDAIADLSIDVLGLQSLSDADFTL